MSTVGTQRSTFFNVVGYTARVLSSDADFLFPLPKRPECPPSLLMNGTLALLTAYMSEVDSYLGHSEDRDKFN